MSSTSCDPKSNHTFFRFTVAAAPRAAAAAAAVAHLKNTAKALAEAGALWHYPSETSVKMVGRAAALKHTHTRTRAHTQLASSASGTGGGCGPVGPRYQTTLWRCRCMRARESEGEGTRETEG